jgi:hypothetical protein
MKWMAAALLLIIGGCVTVWPDAPSLGDGEERNCTYYLYHKHYRGK